MRNTIFLILFSCFQSLSLIGQTEEYSWENQPEILERQDSIILYSNENDQLYLNYTMQDYQTVYRVSKFFGSTSDVVYKINGINVQEGIEKHAVLQIPIKSENIITDFWGRSLFKRYTPVYYKVGSKETQFHIAKVLFSMEVKILKRRNSLRDANLKNGQLLHIGWFPEEGLFEPVISKEMEEDGVSWDQLELAFAKSADKGNTREQRGVAYWNKAQSAAEGLFVLHKKAEVNSYVEIVNPMFGTKIYAKVVGRIPENAYPSEIVAVISPSAAKELRARDARFFVKMRYLQPGSYDFPESN